MADSDAELIRFDRPERTMRYWLGRTLSEIRDGRGALGDPKPRQQDVVKLVPPGAKETKAAHAHDSQLSRLEANQSWPEQLDEMVAAAGRVCGLDRPEAIWLVAALRLLAQDSSSAEKAVEMASPVFALLHAAEAAQHG